MNFANKVVIVTGASSGIGAATAVFFANLSAKLVIVGRNEERLNEVAKKCEGAKGIKPLAIKAEMTVDADVENIINKTIKQFRQIDVLVNNAGAGVRANLSDGIEIFDQMLGTNLRSVYLLTSLATPYLKKTKGNIINVSSIAALTPSVLSMPYSIAKAGLDMFTRCAAKELAPEGVRVNSVNPGPVTTNFRAGLGLSDEELVTFGKVVKKRCLLGNVECTSEEVADLILYLASDKARSITGGIYLIDCGSLLA